jgi:hypothetical protein
MQMTSNSRSLIAPDRTPVTSLGVLRAGSIDIKSSAFSAIIDYRLSTEHRTVARAREKGSEANQKTKRVADSPWVEGLMRLGYVARAVIYGSIGVLALGVAAGIGGQATDPKGSVTLLSRIPGGGVLLAIVSIGLLGYALWCFVCAVYDPLQRGSNSGGLTQRAGFAFAGIANLALLSFTAQLLTGRQQGAGSGPDAIVGRLFELPAGPFLVGLGGVVAIAAGAGQLVSAYRATFETGLLAERMNEAERRTALWLGRAGYAARGVIYVMLGWFAVQAAVTHDARHAQSFGGAFGALAQQPFGHVLLAVVAAGFVALGLHSLASAIWIRMTVR